MEPVDEAIFKDSFNCMITWDDLNDKLRSTLPPKSTSGDVSYSYVIEKYEDLTQETFSGAPEEWRSVLIQNLELTCILKKSLMIGL